MKRLKTYRVFESVEDDDVLIRSIIDIFTDLSEDDRFEIHLQSARGFHWRFNDLLRDGVASIRRVVGNFFRRYSNDSNKSFKINIWSKESLDFIEYSSLMNDLKTEIMRLDDLGFQLSELDLSDSSENGKWILRSITLGFSK